MRKLFLILFLLFCTNAQAQSPIVRDMFYEVSDFSDMLNSQVSPFLLRKGKASEAKNVRANKRYGALSKRETMILYGTCSSAAVEGLYRFYKSDDTNYLIIGSGTGIYVGDDDGGSCTQIGTGFTDGARWDFITYKDLAIAVNGNEQPVKYDGKLDVGTDDGDRTGGYLVAELGAPFAELNTGTDLDASSWYSYKIQCTDGSVSWYIDAVSNAIQTGSSVHNITLTDIPLCPTGTTSRTIYRTEGQATVGALAAATYKLVGTISDNSTRTYNDAVADGSLGATWSTSGKVNLTPPIVKFIHIHEDRIYLANQSDGTTFGRSTFFWSPALNPDIYAVADDYELVRPDDGDQIQGIESLLGILVIIKNNTIQKFFTDSSNTDNWELTSPFSYIGAIAAYSISMAPEGIYFLGSDGIYIFNGQTATLISDKVTYDINDVLRTNLDDIVGIYYMNTYHMAYTSKASGAGANDRILIYENQRNAYSIDTKNISSFAILNSGNDFNVLYGGSSAADGKVWAFELSPNNLIWRLKSELQEGTVDSISYLGTEENSGFEIGWAYTINSYPVTTDTINTLTPSTATINRPGTTGVWYSQGVQVNAQSFSKLFWNESIPDGNDVTFSLRTASTEAGLSSAPWAGTYTDPSGSDISGVSAGAWVQVRATLTTDDITESPQVALNNNYILKVVYQQSGSNKEASFLTIWKTGFDAFQASESDTSNYPKRIKEILVYYEGEIGEIDFNIINSEYSLDHTFTIDLSVDPNTSESDNYLGGEEQKIYRYIPDATAPQLVGRQFQVEISENGQDPWAINRIVYRCDVYDYRTMK